MTVTSDYKVSTVLATPEKGAITYHKNISMLEIKEKKPTSNTKFMPFFSKGLDRTVAVIPGRHVCECQATRNRDLFEDGYGSHMNASC